MTCTMNKQQLFRTIEIQPLRVVVMAGLLLVLTARSSASDPVLKETTLKRQAPNNVLFTEDVLLEVSARSRIECTKKCVETEGCAMCTFISSPQGPPGQCRLHSQQQTLKDGWKNATGAKSLAPRRLCDGGYSLTCGLCLKAVTDNVRYAEARVQCSHLVMPRSAEDIDCVRSILQNIGIDRTWVGADDAETPGVYKWNDGTPLPDSSPLWSSNHPRHESLGGNCVKIREPDPSVIKDTICAEHSYPYICQKDFA